MPAWENAPIVGGEGKSAWESAPIVSEDTQPPMAKKKSQSLSDQIPGSANSLAGNRNIGKPDESSFMDKLKGAGEAGLSILTSSVASPVGQIAGAFEGITGGKYGTKEGVRQAEKRASDVSEKLTYSPKTEKGSEYFGNIADIIDRSGIAGLPIGESMQLARASQAAKQFVKPVLSSAASSVANSPEMYALKEGAKSVADKVPSMSYRLTPEMQALNAKARDYGITLQPHHFSDNKFIKILGETLENVPASGARDEKNQMAFEKALIKQIGGDESSTKLTPKVFDGAMRKSGTTIDAITRKYELPPTKELLGKLNGIVKDANQLETPENAKSISGWADKVFNKMADGPMSGTAFRKLNTDLSRKIRETGNGDLRSALSDIQDALLEEFNNNITDPKDRERLSEARMQYAKAKTIAPIVGDPKGVSPPKLLGAVRSTKSNKERYARGRSGDLGELADIGQLLKDPGSSNTAERGLVYSGLGSGLLGLSNPAFALPAAGIYGGANLYNRFSPYLIRPKNN